MPLTTQAAMSKDKATAKSAELQHRHFAFIASVLADSKPSKDAVYIFGQWKILVRNFAVACQRTNAKFNTQRFFNACGYDNA